MDFVSAPPGEAHGPLAVVRLNLTAASVAASSLALPSAAAAAAAAAASPAPACPPAVFSAAAAGASSSGGGYHKTGSSLQRPEATIAPAAAAAAQLAPSTASTTATGPAPVGEAAVSEEAGADAEEASAAAAATAAAAAAATAAAAAAEAAAEGAVRGVHVRARLNVRVRSLRPPPAPPQPVPPLAQEALALARAGRRAPLAPLPLGGLLGAPTELPSCAVCLERLDPSVSGVYTLLCTHSFHSGCLRRWQDSSCPVCRHVQEESTEGGTACERCGTQEKVWICLVCGHVGCGRYGCGAGLLHNEQTCHNFAMELETQRVWDYAGDNYVHRLIQNKVDGKLVELPDPGQRGGGSSMGGMGGTGGVGGTAQLDGAAVEMKQRGLEQAYEAVEHEYSMLLAGQLEAQRAHYEEQQAVGLAELRSSLEGQLAAAEAVGARAAQKEGLLREMTKRLAERERRLLTLGEERRFEATLNEQLVRNQDEHKALLEASRASEAALRAKLEDMEEQQRDLTFHFEAQLKIAQARLPPLPSSPLPVALGPARPPLRRLAHPAIAIARRKEVVLTISPVVVSSSPQRRRSVGPRQRASAASPDLLRASRCGVADPEPPACVIPELHYRKNAWRSVFETPTPPKTA